jgi:hypothetical protein
MPTKCRDSDPPLGGVLYAGGSYSEGGSYMPVYTVVGSPIYACQSDLESVVPIKDSTAYRLKFPARGNNSEVRSVGGIFRQLDWMAFGKYEFQYLLFNLAWELQKVHTVLSLIQSSPAVNS